MNSLPSGNKKVFTTLKLQKLLKDNFKKFGIQICSVKRIYCDIDVKQNRRILICNKKLNMIHIGMNRNINL